MYVREGSVCDEGDDGEEERVGEERVGGKRKERVQCVIKGRM